MSQELCLRSVPVAMRPIAQYFVERQLMLEERLTYERWSSFDRSADVICNSILERMPVDHPASAIWDNRRKGDQSALRRFYVNGFPRA
jgi:hypothetical protein